MSNENYSELQINCRIYFPSPFKIYKTSSCILMNKSHLKSRTYLTYDFAVKGVLIASNLFPISYARS